MHGPVQGGRGSGGVVGVPLTGEGRRHHAQRGRRGALVVVLPLAFLVQGQGHSSLTPLLTVAEPHSDHLGEDMGTQVGLVWVTLLGDKEPRDEPVSQGAWLTSLSSPRSVEMWVMSWVWGLGHWLK